MMTNLFKKSVLLFFCFILLLPAQAQQAPDTVKLGAYLISLHNFNFREKEYTARFWLWAVYDSTIYKNKLVEFKEGVEVPNAKNINIDEYIVDSTSLKGKRWEQLKLNCSMKQSWEIDHYPFDKQELKILIENAKFDKRSIVFTPDRNGKFYDEKMSVEGWNVEHFSVDTATSKYETGFGDVSLSKPHSEYANLMITVHLERNAWGLYFKLFLGMYVAFAIAFVSLFIDPEHVDPRFGLPVGGLFAAVGNKYVIDSLLPDASILTMVDKLHGLTFIMIFVMIAFSARSLRFDETGQDSVSERLDKIVRWTLLGIYLIINIYLVQDAYFSKHLN